MYPTLYARYVDLAQLEGLARGLARLCSQGAVITLSGELGAGKTTFARVFLQSLDDSLTDIPSPSFTLVQHYETPRAEWLHADLYRLTSRDQAIGLGLVEQVADKGLLLEWPDLLTDDLPANRLAITLNFADDALTLRHVEFQLHGSYEKLFNDLVRLIQQTCPQHSPAQRPQQMQQFLQQHGWQDARAESMSDDASFRRYTRLFQGSQSVLLMDSPPPMEYVWKFTQVAQLLQKTGLTVPAIHAVDDCHGLLLEQDFGDLTATRFVQQGMADDAHTPRGAAANTTEQRLAQVLSLGVQALIHLHQCWLATTNSPLANEDKAAIPPYCGYRMLSDVQIFLDWYLPAAGLTPADAECQRLWHQAWTAVIAQQHCVPEVMILRDYRLDNLMILPKAGQDQLGLESLGLLDFQDAMTAPLTYDLISLLEDARLDFPPDVVARQVQAYLAAFPDISRADFEQSWATVAAVRHTRILGLFARLWRRDDKPVYLVHLPRVWRQLSQALAHPANAGLAAWFDRYVPLACRQLSTNAAAA